MKNFKEGDLVFYSYTNSSNQIKLSKFCVYIKDIKGGNEVPSNISLCLVYSCGKIRGVFKDSLIKV